MYPEYEYYKNKYGGREIDDIDEFYFCFEKAKAYVRRITFDRINGDEEEYCWALCNITDCIKRREDIKGISHEENDGFRIDYKDDETAELFNCAVFFLPSELLYRGI